MTICSRMGSARNYLSGGGFSEYLYETVGEARFINGVRAKVVKLKTDKDGTHTSLPFFANTSDMYLHLGNENQPCQARLYINRQSCLDFDWGHVHRNSDGTIFPKGVIHVQSYSVKPDGSIVRNSCKARYMSEREIEQYGAIIKAFNPNVKFRP